MMYRFEAWSRHVWRWSLPLAFCLLNLLGILIYQTSFAGRVENLQVDYEEAQKELTELRYERQQNELLLSAAIERDQRVRDLYAEGFSTAAERFTSVQLEVKRLAARAGIRPSSFQYPGSDLEWDLTGRQIHFKVNATYEQLRMFINLIELSDFFLALDQVTLSESGVESPNPLLAVGLSLSTVFASPEAVAEVVATPPATEEGAS